MKRTAQRKARARKVSEQIALLRQISADLKVIRLLTESTKIPIVISATAMKSIQKQEKAAG